MILSLRVSFSQESVQGRISGMTVSSKDQQPLPHANVVVEGTKWGTTSNEDGEFEIASLPPGNYTVLARLIGYEDSRLESVVVTGGKITSIHFVMRESPVPLDEILVTAEQMKRQQDIRTSVLSVAPVRTKTLAGVGEDVLRTLQAMPGVLARSDFTSQLIIRGSGPDQNLIVMDDIEVFNPYRLYGIISMFNPETVSDINLITGGFPSKYGDRLSAVLDITNKEGDKSKGLKGSLNASITNANIVFDGRSPFGMEGSYVISARRTYYDLILGPIAKNSGLVKGDVAFPNFSDVQGKFVFEPDQQHKILLNGIASSDAVDLVSGPDRTVPDSINVNDNTRNDVLGLAWHYLPTKNVFSKFGLSWYRNSGDSEFGGEFIDPALNRELFEDGGDTTGIRFFNVEFDSRYVFEKVSLKEEVAWVTENHTIEAGSGIDFLETSLIWHFRPDPTFRAVLESRGVPVLDDFVQTKSYDRIHVFAQDRIKVTDHLTVQPGVRFDYYEILRSSYLQPRFNISYAVNPLTTARAAWGLYRQSPGYEKLLDRNTFIDLTNAGIGKLEAEKATHYVVGVDHWLDNQWQLRCETYYKAFDDVIVQDIRKGTIYEVFPVPGGDVRKPSGWTQPTPVLGDSLTTDPMNGATGRSYGCEILLEKRNTQANARFFGWISYSFAKAERVRNAIITPFQFDQRHTVNVVVDYKLNSWLELGVRWRYGSNFPYTAPIGIKPRIVTVRQNGERMTTIQTDAKGNVIFDIDRGGEENRYSQRLTAYHRLDVRLTAGADYWGLDWSFYLDVINVYNHDNLLAYRYYIKDDLTLGTNKSYMLPLLPTLGLSVRF